jgi:hypothetical protein
MRDPVERMVQFVLAQKRQAAFEHARALWSVRLPALLPCVHAVVEAFRGGLDEPGDRPGVSVLFDPRHDTCPLVVAFARRGHDEPDEGVLRLRPDLPRAEAGASAAFRCEPDGAVHGFRYPFHNPLRDVRPEHFADLSEPDAVTAHALGNAVADFLEWASVGEGRGSRKLRFWSPPAGPSPRQQPFRLADAA